MSQRLRRGIVIVVIGVILVGGGLFVLTAIIRQSLAVPTPPPTPLQPIAENVVVAARDIPLGALLSQSDVTTISVPVELIPRTALRDVEAVVGRISTTPLVEGELILQHHLADPTNISHDLAFVISDDQVLMAFPATDLMSTLSIIQRGDFVDILASIVQETEVVEPGGGVILEGPQTKSTLFTFNAFQRVNVTALVVDIITQESSSGATFGAGGAQATPTQPPTPSRQNIKIKAYLLALSPQDALVLKNLIDAGAIFDIVLRSPTSTTIFDLDPVMEEYIKELYGLEIIR